MVDVVTRFDNSSCYSLDIIENHTPDSSFFVLENPCQLVVNTSESKQVIAVLYNVTNDCLLKGRIQIFDGDIASTTLIDTYCKGVQTSYASRNHSLVLKPDMSKPLKPFDMDIYVIDDENLYTNQSGKIKSEAFPGYVSGKGILQVTPNNFQGTYRILIKLNVSIELYFKEFRILAPCDRDSLQIRITGKTRQITLCGDSRLPNIDLPDPIVVATNEILLDFTTDREDTLTGFDLEYKACYHDVEEEKLSGSFLLPFSHAVDTDLEMVCAFHVDLGRQLTVNLYNLTINSNRTCKNAIQIFVDQEDATEEILGDCDFNAIDSLVVPAYNLSIIFRSSSLESFTGSYVIDTGIVSVSEDTKVTLQSTALLQDTTKGINEKPTSESDGTLIIALAVSTLSVTLLLVILFALVIINRRGILKKCLNREDYGVALQTFNRQPEEDQQAERVSDPNPPLSRSPPAVIDQHATPEYTYITPNEASDNSAVESTNADRKSFKEAQAPSNQDQRGDETYLEPLQKRGPGADPYTDVIPGTEGSTDLDQTLVSSERPLPHLPRRTVQTNKE